MADNQTQVRQDKSEVPPSQEQRRQSGSNRGSSGERRKHSGDRSRDEGDWQRKQGHGGSSGERRNHSGDRSRDERNWQRNPGQGGSSGERRKHSGDRSREERDWKRNQCHGGYQGSGGYQGHGGSNERYNNQYRQEGTYRQNNSDIYYGQNRQDYAQNYGRQYNGDFSAPRGRGFGIPTGRYSTPDECGQGYYGRGPPYLEGGGQMGHNMPAQNFPRQQYNSGFANQYPGRRKREDDDVVFLSKTLSYILRHGAEKQGFQLMKGGFLYVDEILRRTQKLRGFSSKDIEMVVQTNDKQRFALEKDEDGRLKIRANQGHTIEVEDLDLEEISSPTECPTVIHGTYYSSWEIIKNSGLSRMGRNHVHFAAGEPGENGVISGMRKTCDVLIFIDLENALKDGLKFYRSANNVILCPGDEKGIIYPRYFSAVVTRYPRQKLDFDNTITKETVKHESAADISKHSGKSKEKTENRPVGLPEQEEREKKTRKKKNKKKGKERNEAEPDRNNDNMNEDVKSTAEKIAAEKQNNIQKNWDSIDDAAICQEENKKSVDELDETFKMDSEECCSGTNTERTESDNSKAVESLSSDTLIASSQIGGAEAAPSPDKDIIIIADADHSKCVVQHILGNANPGAMAVCCYGDHLGTEESKIHLLILVTDDEAYAYRLKDDDGTIIKEGNVKELFNDPRINKIFNRIKPQSLSLIHEWDILLDGTPIWDLTILYDKLSQILSKTIIKMIETTGLNPSDWTDDEITSEVTSTELSKDTQRKALKRGRDMLNLYHQFEMHRDQMRDVKSYMYDAASPKEGFMAKKIMKLKEQKKIETKQKKKEEKSQQSKQQTSPNKKGNKKKK